MSKHPGYTTPQERRCRELRKKNNRSKNSNKEIGKKNDERAAKVLRGY
jgi:hypothetical protein